MRDFLENYELYEEYLLLEGYTLNNEHYTDYSEFRSQRFEYFCPKERSNRPFELEFPNSILNTLKSRVSPNMFNHEYNTIPEENFIDEKLDYTFWILGNCQSCNKHKIHFLLNVFSNKPISNIRDNIRNIRLDKRHENNFPNTNIYIRKIGCSDIKKVEVDKAISKHFDRESNNWLFKAKSLLKLRMGIGAFAYFRRIIEKELINIINEIKELPDSESNEIQKLLDKYHANKTTSTIYENIYAYLPNSLKELGENPIKLLYKQTSGGLHSISEEECLKRANSIEIILEFTIRKIQEEKSEIKSMKDAIKKLKS
ncbi:hypothetical protein H2O64_09215 [Kordia sp. YSTF-M3]|uniref:Uncharacterized protein n=1 Tax=Kordia aestuariivivens TaxID=2759037 RepID=A0ABR7Q8H7_9FLAO|nr:hypothetical protein [Kordia aestuariivivens]MBC8754848.1 hypothetical protein [Kordia aestuariivivens]